jgi:putative tricarboxylic transport membrane protein
MRRADQVFSLVLMLLGAYVTVESWRMPRFEELHVQPMTAPGLTPALIGIVILVLGAVLLLQSLFATRPVPPADSPADASDAAAAPADGEGGLLVGYRRVLLVLATTFLYAAGLVGRLPFWLATGLFVFAFVYLFEAGNGRPWGRRMLSAVVLAVVVSGSVTWLFQEVFLVRLP